ncbi:helix-turn-helix-type transcriptional regulator, partial [Klebsiella pneumoniae]|uniref:helix-turn-helix-type transcriptional regulator n=2 Tax=Enterobacterales TaxID=91347 RepID=UPI0025A28054
SGVPVSKVKALLEEKKNHSDDNWTSLQEEMMGILRQVRPARLRAAIATLGRDYPADDLIDHVFVPVRQRLCLEQNTARAMGSLLDGALINYAALCLGESLKKSGREALLIGWGTEDRTRLWLEAWRLSRRGWHIDVLAEPLDSPRPELFPGQHIFVWAG